MSDKLTFVKPDMRKGCESESIRIAGIYLRLMVESDAPNRVLSGSSQEKHLWRKMYLGFMRKENVQEVGDRHAYQILYALNRHYEVCIIKNNTIEWTCANVREATTKLTIGTMEGEMHWLYGELRKAQNEITRLSKKEEGECV